MGVGVGGGGGGGGACAGSSKLFISGLACIIQFCF